MATTLSPTGIRLNRAAEQAEWVRDRQIHRDKGNVRHERQKRTIEFSPNSCRDGTLWSLFFGYLSAVKWTVQDTDNGDTETPQTNSESLMLKHKSKTDILKHFYQKDDKVCYQLSTSLFFEYKNSGSKRCNCYCGSKRQNQVESLYQASGQVSPTLRTELWLS